MAGPDVRLVCPGCGHGYTPEDVEVIGHHMGSFLIRCTCRCERIAMFLVDTAVRRAPVTFEDVLIAHEYLEGYVGDAMGLFEAPPEIKQ